jgi:hypothetical protein
MASGGIRAIMTWVIYDKTTFGMSKRTICQFCLSRKYYESGTYAGMPTANFVANAQFNTFNNVTIFCFSESLYEAEATVYCSDTDQ